MCVCDYAAERFACTEISLPEPHYSSNISDVSIISDISDVSNISADQICHIGVWNAKQTCSVDKRTDVLPHRRVVKLS